MLIISLLVFNKQVNFQGFSNQGKERYEIQNNLISLMGTSKK